MCSIRKSTKERQIYNALPSQPPTKWKKKEPSKKMSSSHLGIHFGIRNGKDRADKENEIFLAIQWSEGIFLLSRLKVSPPALILWLTPRS